LVCFEFGRELFGRENWMPDFRSFSTKALNRIVEQFPDHAREVRGILDARAERFCMESAVAYLTKVAKENKTVGYKEFTDHCTSGRSWAQMRNQVRFYLDDVQGYCIDHEMPLLSALVVNQETGECGEGFLVALVNRGLANPETPVQVAATEERKRLQRWARAREQAPIGK
jgi:hypothetical protein